MAYTIVALKEKIIEMYPEITQHGISMGLDFSEEKNAYIIKYGGMHLTPVGTTCSIFPFSWETLLLFNPASGID
jgi:hypothetical protein